MGEHFVSTKEASVICNQFGYELEDFTVSLHTVRHYLHTAWDSFEQ